MVDKAEQAKARAWSEEYADGELENEFGLNFKQAAFVREYLVDANGTHAALRAGYAKSRAAATAVDLLSRPGVSAAIKSAQRDRAKAVGIDMYWVIAKLREVVEVSLEARPVASMAACRALELLMRHLGGIVEKHEHKFRIEDLDKMSPDEIDQLADKIEKRVVN